jgi:hypothetical protein
VSGFRVGIPGINSGSWFRIRVRIRGQNLEPKFRIGIQGQDSRLGFRVKNQGQDAVSGFRV